MKQTKTKLKNLSLSELTEFLQAMGQKPFRARQVLQWLYQKRVDDFGQMRNIAKTLQQNLAQCADIAKLPVVAEQRSPTGNAIKLAIQLSGKPTEVVECVALKDGKRQSACLSTQLGCKYGCCYCSTALMGFHRNLDQLEILEQLIALQDAQGDRRITNIVFMGMGEPLDNLQNVLRAIEVIQSDFGFAIGGRKITISTCGLVPKIRELANLQTNVGLAVSLNAPNNTIRNQLVPINKKYPIEQLLDAGKYYFQKTGRRVTFEYVLIDGMNCSDANMQELRDLISPYKCKLNLIAFNPKPNCPFQSPSPSRIREIVKFMEQSPFTVTLRKSLGTEIAAACGQLYRETAGNS